MWSIAFAFGLQVLAVSADVLVQSQAYTVTLTPVAEPLCMPCDALRSPVLESLLVTDSGTMCCLRNLTQLLDILNSQITSAQLQAAATSVQETAPYSGGVSGNIAMHAVLRRNTQQGGPPSANSIMQDIPKTEWMSTPDFAFCNGGATSSHFCEGISGSGSMTNGTTTGIKLPEHGMYQITCQITWATNVYIRSLPGTSVFTVEVSRMHGRRSSSRHVLGSDSVTSTNCSNSQMAPCATGRVQQTLRLRDRDQIFIRISHKGLLERNSAYSFLEIRKLS